MGCSVWRVAYLQRGGVGGERVDQKEGVVGRLVHPLKVSGAKVREVRQRVRRWCGGSGGHLSDGLAGGFLPRLLQHLVA